MSCGVYAITNVMTKKHYIGSASNIEARWIVHRTVLKQNRHHSRKLQNSWNKHGANAFAWRILKHCSKRCLMQEEQHFIDSFKAFSNGYNASPSAISAAGQKRSLKTKRKLSQAALRVASRPGEHQRRSLRAKQQHRQGKFGHKTWTAKSRKKIVEAGRRTAKRFKLWQHVYKHKSRQEVWTPARRRAAAERARNQRRYRAE
jgi:group I intron endonuclease